jgi:membrane protease YdiL (CAAX protease family)
MNDRLREVLAVTGLTLVAIRLIVELLQGVAWDLGLALVPVLFMWVPVWVLRWRGEDPDRYPLAVPGLDEGRAWGVGAAQGLGLGLLILAPYVAVYHLWQTSLLPSFLDWLCDLGWRDACREAARAHDFAPSWRLPDEPLKLIAYHLFFVAIPEELFYRGYVQSRLDEAWAPRWRVFGAKLGPGWLVTSLVFALGHSVVLFQWWHLAIFIPSLAFGWLRARTGGVVAGAFFHAWCNVLVAFLDAAWGVSTG